MLAFCMGFTMLLHKVIKKQNESASSSRSLKTAIVVGGGSRPDDQRKEGHTVSDNGNDNYQTFRDRHFLYWVYREFSRGL
ncbi:4028_t:CDS:2 [Funneliformis caledonium]|uniref:4028_t:CDS:1 n=1 Tax=Funneliformis caledonium TaxID=1117310 RepID=A0A9N9GUZ7_9GLOM|nr:4028_t:CDS:2 [Funneliformis caledonium]